MGISSHKFGKIKVDINVDTLRRMTDIFVKNMNIPYNIWFIHHVKMFDYDKGEIAHYLFDNYGNVYKDPFRPCNCGAPDIVHSLVRSEKHNLWNSYCLDNGKNIKNLVCTEYNKAPLSDIQINIIKMTYTNNGVSARMYPILFKELDAMKKENDSLKATVKSLCNSVETLLAQVQTLTNRVNSGSNGKI